MVAGRGLSKRISSLVIPGTITTQVALGSVFSAGGGDSLQM